MKYPLATETWTSDEKEAAKRVIDSGMCTMGKITQEFEQKFAELVGSKYAVFSNSGSSANLLAVASCVFCEKGLKPGDEVIVPAVSWSTTFYPLHQYGLKLVFVDVDDNLNIDVENIKDAITDKTRAIMAVNLLGMPCEYESLLSICNDNELILLEDNCESMGAKYNDKQCGTFGEVGTFSTFFSHHICTVEGGITVTNNEEMYHIMLSVRSHGWLRHLPNENRVENKTGDPFVDSFRFVLPGYNLRGNDIFAAIGLEQLGKLDRIIENRRKNAQHLKSRFDGHHGEINGVRIIQNESVMDDISRQSSWFGFAFYCNGIDRKVVVDILMEAGVDCRPIVAGNFCKNPVINFMDHRIHGNLKNADIADRFGFFIGNNGEDLTKEIDYFIDVVKGLSNE